MQKTFIRYAFAILTAAVFLIFSINCLITLHTLESQQYNTFCTKAEQVIHTLKNNQMELSLLKENLDEDYLTRARAAAYVLDRNKEVSMDVEEMQYLANLLNVDELHMIDEHGIIVSASVPQYVGFDMSVHEQTRAFLDLLDREDGAYLIQEAQPNAAESKIMQYVGVARSGHKGVVQVGFKPTRQMEAQSRNTYEYIFSKFPTDTGEELFAVDSRSGAVLGHSAGMDQEFKEPCYQLKQLQSCAKGAHKKGKDGRHMYVFSKQYNNILICASLPMHILFQRLLEHVISTLLYLLMIETVVILLLNYLVKRKVVDGIHQIMDHLSAITQGNLDTMAAVGGNLEFESLSQGLNTMVKSIVSSSDRISAIIEISGIPLAAFEYESGVNHVFVTSGLRNLLDLSDQQADSLYRDSAKFGKYIRELTTEPLEGETDIFRISDTKYIRIHMSKSQGKYLGVVTDVSKDIMEKRRMQYENTHDTLTGLYKFAYFKQLAGEALSSMEHGTVCAAVMLDLDFFKTINDTFGHDIGDKYLQCFAGVMKSMPSGSFITARRSGDEFCMFLYGCRNKGQVEILLEQFYKALGEEKIQLAPGEKKSVSASGGFAWTDDSRVSVEELLNHADEALYEIKRDKKGTYGEYCA